MARLRGKRNLQLKELGINERYRPFFRIELRRSTSTGKHVAVVIPELFSEFLSTVKEDTAIPVYFRVLISVLLSGGLRISEALKLQRCDFESGKDGELFFHSRVLKKKSQEKVERKSVIHSEAKALVSEHLLTLRGFDYIFRYTRKSALHELKKYLGPSVDLHALRHSYFSYLIFKKELNIAEVSRLVEVSLSTVLRYAHLDQEAVLANLFDPGKAKRAS